MIEDLVWHHGTCDYCNAKQVVIAHYNYEKQPERSFCLCRECLRKGLYQFELERGLRDYPEFILWWEKLGKELKKPSI